MQKMTCLILTALAIFLVTMWDRPAVAVKPGSSTTPLVTDICTDFELSPPFLTTAAPPLVMLVMGRDHKLYYEAYNDASDVDGDGVLDVGYKPEIDYYGYFDSNICYTYSSEKFSPHAVTSDKTCNGTEEWSGDFLNYLTMSRMDCIRKVLYGGYRRTDTTDSTVLERCYIPQDAHSWGKAYAGIAEDGYDIRDYTPITSLPSAGNKHLFASTTLSDGGNPLLRVLLDKPYDIWQWVSRETPVAGTKIQTTSGDVSVTPDDYTVRVDTCVAGFMSGNCKTYPGSDATNASDDVYKPIGLLQKYGEAERMYFGLISGSYEKSTSGGVLRKNISSINDEISNATGIINSSPVGIIKTIDSFKIYDFDYSSHSYGGGNYQGDDVAKIESDFPDWNNPVAEMMYEGMRYFAGAKSPTRDYVYSEEESVDSKMGLPLETWEDPYDTFAYCSEPIALVISDINPSYDTDQLPGSSFNADWSASSLGNIDVASLANTISSNEQANGTFFIGQSGIASSDGICSEKNVAGFGTIRGLCPEEPTKKGGYYSSSVSYYGKTNDLNSDTGNQTVTTYAVALSSPLPRIEINTNGQTVTVVPFGKTVSTDQENLSSYQASNTIVDFYVESMNATYGKFRINFEDTEQGADHDMDTVVSYEYQVQANGTISITLEQVYAAAGYIQHLGYVISGTTADGVYLEVANIYDNPNNNNVSTVNGTTIGKDVDSSSDTPPGYYHPGTIVWDDDARLPQQTTRIFTPSSIQAASLLNDPLWYAAKWGGFQDTNGNNIPDGNEWDRNGDNVPDTYFFVSNPGKLEEALNKAFAGILKRVSAGSAASVVSGSRSGEGGLYQAVFWPSKLDDDGNEITWIGDVHGFFVDNEGNLYADSNSNARHDSTDERVVIYLDEGSGKSQACVGGQMANGTCTNGTVEDLEDIDYLWSAANWLNKELDPIDNRLPYNSDAKKRYLFTWFDSNLDGKVNDTTIDSNGEVVEFTAANMASLNATNVCNASVVKWIRGEDQTGMRSRKYIKDLPDYYWRLGDVIYSTPTVVGRPAENYDLFWGDASYTAFYGKYRNRRNVVYFGGNDGILHAVNAGFYSASDKGFYKGYSSGTFTDSGMDLGAELWGYVPYNLLPHLKCLTRPDYKHKYYVDLHPRVFDVRIWENEYNDSTGTHPNGWGTILVCGMRFGGSHVAVDGRDFSSSYIIFDVTDPETPPVLLGEITYDYSDSSIAQLGYTQSVPSVVPVKNALGAQKWFLIMGSGPDAENINVTDAASTQKARLAVIPLNELARGDFSLQIPDSEPASDGTTAGVKTMSVSNSYVGSDFVAVDYDFDFYTDIFYYGLVSGETESWGGGVYRLKVEDKQNEANWGDPSKWGIHELIDTDAPVTGPVNLGWVDDQVWVYFGTGRFLTADDVRDTAPNYFFGIKEPKQTSGETSAFNFNTVTINYKNPSFNNWVKANDILVGQNTGVLNCTDGSDTCLPSGVTTLNELAAYNMETPNGWFREFNATGERVIGQPTLLGGLVNFTSYIPDSDLCSSEGDSLFYALYYLTGTPWWQDVFGDQSPSDPYVQFTKSLGKGMSVTPSLHIGKQEGAKAFVQTSTGAIVEIHEPNLPIKNVKSGKSGWHTHDIE